MTSTQSTQSTHQLTINEFDFEIDPELTNPEFNTSRVPRLPYAIVINDNPAGIFISEKNILKSGWNGTPEMIEFDLPGGKDKGVLITNARMLILGSVRPYIRYKNSEELGEMARSLIGWYDENFVNMDKKVMDAVSEHLIVFLGEDNEPLHQRPFSVRFKNVALWSLKEALDEFYIQVELVFAKITGTSASGKSDRWRALCVFNVQFKAYKEGEGSNKSWCCKVENYLRPTVENFGAIFLGQRNRKARIWEMLDMNAGYVTRTALPSSPTKSALAGSPIDELPY